MCQGKTISKRYYAVRTLTGVNDRILNLEGVNNTEAVSELQKELELR